MAKFKFKYGVLEFEIEGDEQLVKERSEFIFNNFKNSETLSSKEMNADRIDDIDNESNVKLLDCHEEQSLRVELPPLSVFMNEKNFVKDCDVFLGLAYYLEQSKDVREWSVKDVEEMYKTARKSLPKNISQNIRPNYDKGYINNVSTKGTKTYTFTDRGIEYIENFANNKEKQKGKVSKRNNKPIMTPEIIEANKQICKADLYDSEQISILKNCTTQKDIVIWCSDMIVSKFGESYEITYSNISSLAKKFGCSMDDTKVQKVISASKEYYDVSKSKYYIFNGVGREYANQIRSAYNEKLKKEEI